MLGNDVVDLRDPETAPGASHARFDDRVFAPSELAAVTDESSRWRLWAAKESSYKAARKLDPTLGFSPRRFEVRKMNEDESMVTHADLSLVVRTAHHDGAVHAVAVLRRADERTSADCAELVSGFERVEDEDPSIAVRRFAIERIAGRLGIDAERIAIARDGRIPILRIDGRPASIELSLSHHGGVVGFAALLPGRGSGGSR